MKFIYMFAKTTSYCALAKYLNKKDYSGKSPQKDRFFIVKASPIVNFYRLTVSPEISVLAPTIWEEMSRRIVEFDAMTQFFRVVLSAIVTLFQRMQFSRVTFLPMTQPLPSVEFPMNFTDIGRTLAEI